MIINNSSWCDRVIRIENKIQPCRDEFETINAILLLEIERQPYNVIEYNIYSKAENNKKLF